MWEALKERGRGDMFEKKQDFDRLFVEQYIDRHSTFQKVVILSNNSMTTVRFPSLTTIITTITHTSIS